jgi:DNA invertase Pin-like site-specific DNA recombinase
MTVGERRQLQERRPAWWDAANDRAMLICRVSDKKQLDGVSLEAQQHELSTYAERVGLRVVAIESFQESAKKSQLRAEFHAAIAKARKSRILHVVFYMWDRIARNFTDTEILEEMIREGDVVLHVASGGTVLHKESDDSDFFILDINIAQAKQDNRGRRRKTITGMEQRCRNGWYPSRTPSFYWQAVTLDEDGRPRRRGSTVAGPTEEGRRLVRREMDLHLKGFSLERIRERCLAEGLVPAKQRPTYTATLIDKHLKNVFYAAIPNPHLDPDKPNDVFRSQFVWRDKWYEGKHEPIFSADEWTKLQGSFGQRTAQRKLKHNGLFANGPLTLTCAEPACGCKITYAPKFKASGVTYHYYRCANGRRVHSRRGEPQVNVREEEILDQFQSAVDAVQITADLADAIVKGLNDTHFEAMAAKKKSADVSRAELRALEEKENRLFDRFDSGEIDRAMFDAQVVRVRAARGECFEKLREADTEIDSAYLVTAQRVLELAKHAKSHWDRRSPQQKRELLAEVVCNSRLNGRTLRYDLQKPFDVLAKMRAANEWCPQGDTRYGEHQGLRGVGRVDGGDQAGRLTWQRSAGRHHAPN